MYVYHKGLKGSYKEPREDVLSAGEKQVDRVKEFSIIDLFFFFFLGCPIRTAYSEIIRKHG